MCVCACVCICVCICVYQGARCTVASRYLCVQESTRERTHEYVHAFLEGYCSTVQGLRELFEADLGFTKLLFIQTDLCVVCVLVCARKHARTHT